MSKGTGRTDDQPLYDRLWGSGFLPSKHQGVKFRNGGDPVLYLVEPAGRRSPACRREMLDELGALNSQHLGAVGDPEIATRIAQYEMAFRMQTSVPELADIVERTREHPRHVRSRREKAGHLRRELSARAASRRTRRALHSALSHGLGPARRRCPRQSAASARDTDQPTAALIKDLKQRGLLDDTLIVWGGEFGRTVYSQGELTCGQLRPRPSSALLHGLDGRRRSQSRHDARRNRRLLIQHRQGSGPRSRPQRHDPTSHGHRPHPPDVPLPRPRFPSN